MIGASTYSAFMILTYPPTAMIVPMRNMLLYDSRAMLQTASDSLGSELVSFRPTNHDARLFFGR